MLVLLDSIIHYGLFCYVLYTRGWASVDYHHLVSKSCCFLIIWFLLLFFVEFGFHARIQQFLLFLVLSDRHNRPLLTRTKHQIHRVAGRSLQLLLFHLTEQIVGGGRPIRCSWLWSAFPFPQSQKSWVAHACNLCFNDPPLRLYTRAQAWALFQPMQVMAAVESGLSDGPAMGSEGGRQCFTCSELSFDCGSL